MPTKLNFEEMAAGFIPLGDCLQSALALAAIQLGDGADKYLNAAKIALSRRVRKSAGLGEFGEVEDDEGADELEALAGKLIGVIDEMIEGVRSSVRGGTDA